MPVLIGFAALSAFFGVSTHAASAPNITSYQGRILNTNGVPVAATTASMKFEFYDALSGGTCLWSNASATCVAPAARTVTLTDGLFSENLGDTAAGVPYAAIADTVFGNNAGVYLEVTVNGEILSPRKQIVAAPYALNADTLDGLDSSAFTSLFTDGGTYTYLTSATDDFVIGGVTPAAGKFFFDESLAELNLGTDSTLNGLIRIYNSGAAIPGATLSTNTSGDLILTSVNVISTASNITSSADLALNGGDFTSTAGTFNLLNATGDSATINIGGSGPIVDIANNLNIATNGTSADTIIMGNGNAGTTVSLTGGDDWNISSTGVLTLSASAASTTAIVATDTDYTNALSVGDNNIIGTTGAIDFTNFDVSSAGTINIAVNQGLDTNAAGALTIGGVNATSLTLCNSPACASLSIGTSFNANTISIGEASDSIDLTSANWSIANNGLGTFLNLTSASLDKASAGVLAIGNTNATSMSLCNSAACDTIDIANYSDADTINIGLDATAGDTISIGNSNVATTLALIGGPSWSLDASGLLTLANGLALNSPFFSAITSSATVGFNFLDNTGDTPTIDIGGVGTDLANTISIATDATSADTVSIGSAHASSVMNLKSGLISINDGLGIATSINIGTGAAFQDTISVGNTNAATTLSLTGGTAWSVSGAGLITSADDLALNGGDITSTSATFNFLDLATNSSNIDIGGVDSDRANQVRIATDATSADNVTIGSMHASSTLDLYGGNNVRIQGGTVYMGETTSSSTITVGSIADSATTINLATEGTTADTIAIGNSHASTLLTLTGGNDWSITNAGDIAMNGGDFTSTSATFNFLNAAADSSTIKIGGVDVDRANSIQIATDATSADSITIGSFHASSSAWIRGANTDLTGTAVLGLNDGGGAKTTNIGGVVSNGGDTINIATNASTTDVITIGNSTAGTTASIIGGTAWQVTTAGDFTMNFGGTATTNGVCHSGANSDTTAVFRALVVCSGAPADYAEWYETDGTPTNGDIVALTSSMFTYQAQESDAFTGEILSGTVTKSLPVLTRATSADLLFGIVSTSPNETIGTNVRDQGAHPLPIALDGRVPLHVTSENGPIIAGDYLTASSTPGYAMKATAPGRVVGRALTSFNGVGMTTITVFIDNTWYGGNMLAADGSALAISGDLQLSSLARATASTQTQSSHALLLAGSGWDGATSIDVNMGLRTKVNSLSKYRLAFENNLGGEIASITNSGDILVSGNLYPSDRGLTQTNAYIFYDSSVGGGYMKTNAAGWNVGSYDFAEMFPSDETLAAGEVVVFADHAQGVKKSGTTKYDEKLVGVVSTRPGFLAGEYKAGSYPIALSGRVPTNVSDENGAVAIGDPLTTSSTPGVAMKATKAGPILGYAMEPWSSGAGQVVAFIRASYYSGSGTNAAPDVSNTVSGITSSNGLDLSGALNMNGGNILSVGSMEGIGGAWKIAENGDFTTQGAVIKQVKSFAGDLVSTYPAATTERTVELSGTSTLQNGIATVTFSDVDVHFNQIISNTASYRVLVTPAGATGQIYVTDRSNGGFIIHDTGASTGILVDWLVIAYEKDHEPQLVTPAPEPTPVPVPEPVVAGVVDPAPVDPMPVDPPIVDLTVPIDAPVDPATIDPVPADPVAPVDSPVDPTPIDPTITP